MQFAANQVQLDSMMLDKHVAHFSDLYRPKIDGVSISTELLRDEFKRINVPSDFFVPKTPGTYTDPENVYRFSSVPLLFQPEVRLSVPIDPANLTRAYGNHYDIIHMHTLGPMGLIAWQVAKLHNVPLIHTYHAFFPEYSHYLFDGKMLNEHAINELSRWWAHRSDALIAPSNKIHDWLVEIGVTRPIYTIPSGIKTSTYSSKNVDRNYLISRGFVSPDDFVMLFVGRVATEKALDKLINYVSTLPLTIMKHAKLVVVGGGPRLSTFRSDAAHRGLEKQVIFTDYVPVEDIANVYASADVLTFLSTSETQGLVVTEALSAGLPVVLSSDKAYSGMVISGVNGYTVDTKEAFSLAIESLMEDPDLQKRFSEASLKMSEDFDIGVTSQKLLAVYEQTIEDFHNTHGKSRFVTSAVEQYRKSLKDAMVELQTKLKQYV